MKSKIIIILLCAIFIFTAVAIAQELTGKQIIQKVSDRASSTTIIMQVRMTITDRRGDTRARSIISRMKDSKTGGKTVVTFLKPDDVKGTKFLVIENKSGDDDQFLYMPALGKPKRISSKQKSGKFMGTDFSYADLQAHDPNKGTHTRLDDESIDGNLCYKVQTVPNNPEDYEYSKIIYWVRQDNDIPVKGEFYDKSGELLKVLTITNIEKNKDGKWVVKDSLMKNVQKGTSTRMEVLQYQTNVNIPDDFFSERFLKDESKL